MSLTSPTDPRPGAAAGWETDPVPRDRGPKRWARAVAASVLIAVLLVATAAGFQFIGPDPLPVRDAGPVLTVNIDQPDGWPTAAVSGALQREDDCLLLDDALALFPDGTSWDASGEVVFADGTRWPIGQDVAGGGGFYDAHAVVDSDWLDDAAADDVAGCAADLDLDGPDSVVLVSP